MSPKDTVSKRHKRAQDLHLTTFRSRRVAGLPPMVKGHKPMLYPNEGHLESDVCWLGVKESAVGGAG